jgi:hypothetical protein
MTHTRTGSTLLEAVAGLGIMMVVGTLVAQVTVVATRQLRAGAMRQVATQEAANLLAQLVADTAERPQNEAEATWPLSPEAAQQLTDGILHVTIDDEVAPPTAQRIAVELSWKTTWGDEREQVRLVSWRYARAAEVTP